MIPCPSCHGDGQTGLSFIHYASGPGRIDRLRCFTCKGEKQITEEHAARIERGKLMYRERIGRGKTLREDAARLGCDFGEWSRIEHGSEPETEAGRRALETRLSELEAV